MTIPTLIRTARSHDVRLSVGDVLWAVVPMLFMAGLWIATPGAAASSSTAPTSHQPQGAGRG